MVLFFCAGGGLGTQDCLARDREVFIWYVNETSPVGEDLANYETLIQWLETGETEKARSYAEGLRNEMILFQDAVDLERQVIETGTIAADGHVDAMIITNQLAREGKYRFFDSKQSQFVEASMTIAVNSDDYVIKSNPLTCGESLRAVLAEAARRYDPSSHEFVLITKSHGGPDFAITVRLARHHEDLTVESLLASLEAESGSLPPRPEIGVSKADYFDIIRESGDLHSMRFPLVFMESCRGTFEESEKDRLPENVELLYTSGDRTLRYSTIDYEAVFESIGDDRDLSESLDEFLEPKYMALFRRDSRAVYAAIWFVPLIILGLLWVSRRLKMHFRGGREGNSIGPEKME